MVTSEFSLGQETREMYIKLFAFIRVEDLILKYLKLSLIQVITFSY